MKSLVIFYSKSGKTRLVAQSIKEEMKAHTKEVVDYTTHRTVIDYLFTSLIDSSRINPQKIEVNYYDTIFIGTPVWFGSMTPAIKKIIDNSNFKNKNIVLFNTMKIGGNYNCLKKMTKLVQKSNGNVIGAFSIRTNCSDIEIINKTKDTINNLNLK